MREVVRKEVLSWIKEAKADLKRAKRALEEEDYALSTFMSQQASEKAFKALYIFLLNRLYPRTHDLTVLLDGIKDRLQVPKWIIDRLPEVSQYYIVARYPNAGLEVPSESISREQALRALEVAEEVIKVAERKIKATN